MKCVFVNCQGLTAPTKQRLVFGRLQELGASVAVLSEVKGVVAQRPRWAAFQEDTCGAGGVAVAVKFLEGNFPLLFASRNIVAVRLTVPALTVVGVYFPCSASEKREWVEVMADLLPALPGPLAVGGDFNHAEEAGTWMDAAAAAELSCVAAFPSLVGSTSALDLLWLSPSLRGAAVPVWVPGTDHLGVLWAPSDVAPVSPARIPR